MEVQNSPIITPLMIQTIESSTTETQMSIPVNQNNNDLPIFELLLPAPAILTVDPSSQQNELWLSGIMFFPTQGTVEFSDLQIDANDGVTININTEYSGVNPPASFYAYQFTFSIVGADLPQPGNEIVFVWKDPGFPEGSRGTVTTVQSGG